MKSEKGYIHILTSFERLAAEIWRFYQTSQKFSFAYRAIRY
jgi:hypothetical protein